MNNQPISKLIQIQERDKLTDKQMGERLGCSRSLWTLTRTGRVPLGAKVIKGIFKGFPELHTLLSLFLSNDVKESERSADKAVG